MQHLSKIILFSALALSLASNCARKRSVERRVDTEGNRWAKADFETGKPWLGRVTVVNNGSNSAFGFVGMQSDVSLGYFRFTKDHLQFLALDDPFKGPNSSDPVINEWQIEHSEYTQKVSNGRVSNVETENDLIPVEQKKFFKVKWESALISEATSFPFSIDESCWSRRAARLVDDSQEITAASINFTIAVDYQVNPKCIDAPQYFRSDFTHTMEYKYSYMVEPESGYKPYVYTGENDPLMKKYGYFNTIVPGLNELNRSSNTFLMNRWDPAKTQTIYFTPSFPPKYKWIYNDPESGIIAQTNKLFERNKIKLRFKIEESDGSQKFGDLRYSFVHMIEEPDFQAPFGYGPMSAHPKTGEIISSTSVIWISGLKYYLQIMKEYEGRAPNRAVSSSLYREMKNTLAQDAKNWTFTSSYLSDPRYAAIYRFLLPEFTYGRNGSAFANHENSKPDYLQAHKATEPLRGQKPQSQANLDNAIAQTLSTIADQLKAEEGRASGRNAQKYSTVWWLNDQMFTGMLAQLQGVDADKAINDILYRVAIHEFGHNLSLRHNFYGSVDAGADRASVKDPKKLVTSSVMDYLALKDEVGLSYDWEAYDVAALVYAYSNGANDLPAAAQRFPYLYCTDEHVFQNPLCNQFDIGSTPSEILLSKIESYDESYNMRNFRYGRAFWDTSNYYSQIFFAMMDVKRFVNLYASTFDRDQISSKLVNFKDFNPNLIDPFANAIGDDMRQSVKLSAAFFNAVIKQGVLDRDFRDQYDEFSGSLTRLGISADKLFAARFLMGNDALPLNPNIAGLPASYVPMRDDNMIGPFLDRVLADTFVNGGDMYLGFSDYGRAYFAANAASYFDFTGNRGAIELTRVACFKKASFAAAFNVNPDSVSIDGGAPTALQLAILTPTYNANADSYFIGEARVAVIRLNGDFYVAGLSKNPYAAALYLKAPQPDVNGILVSYRNYSWLTEGRIPECR